MRVAKSGFFVSVHFKAKAARKSCSGKKRRLTKLAVFVVSIGECFPFSQCYGILRVGGCYIRDVSIIALP